MGADLVALWSLFAHAVMEVRVLVGVRATRVCVCVPPPKAYFCMYLLEPRVNVFIHIDLAQKKY